MVRLSALSFEADDLSGRCLYARSRTGGLHSIRFMSPVADSLESLDAYPHAVVFVNVRSFEADQFEQGERYVVSVDVDSRARQAGLMGVDLLGYERANNTQAATAVIIHISHQLDH